MKIFPKVTLSLVEYIKHAKGNYVHSETSKGQYFNGMMWIKELNIITITHELIHHILHSIGNGNGSTRLFFDFIDTIYETLHGILFYKDWRRNIKYAFENVRCSWKDFLDFSLCREIEGIN